MASGRTVSAAQLNDALFQAATAPRAADPTGSGGAAGALAGAGSSGVALTSHSGASSGAATGRKVRKAFVVDERTPRFPPPQPSDGNSLLAMAAARGERARLPLVVASLSPLLVLALPAPASGLVMRCSEGAIHWGMVHGSGFERAVKHAHKQCYVPSSWLCSRLDRSSSLS